MPYVQRVKKKAETKMGNTDSSHDVEMSSLSVMTANDRPHIMRTPMRPMIAEYEPKKQGVKTELSDVVLVKLAYKLRA